MFSGFFIFFTPACWITPGKETKKSVKKKNYLSPRRIFFPIVVDLPDSTPCLCDEAQCVAACPSPSLLAVILGSSIPLLVLASIAAVSLIVLTAYKHHHSGSGLQSEEKGDVEAAEEVEREGKGEEEEHVYEEVLLWAGSGI